MALRAIQKRKLKKRLFWTILAVFWLAAVIFAGAYFNSYSFISNIYSPLPSPVKLQAKPSQIEIAKKVLELKKALARLGFSIGQVKLSQDLGLVAYLEKGPKLYFSLKEPLSSQLQVLQAALTEDDNFRALLRNFRYIDLRVPGRIYYK